MDLGNEELHLVWFLWRNDRDPAYKQIEKMLEIKTGVTTTA
jgi:hypothetical protein